jgi:hypothetical protein
VNWLRCSFTSLRAKLAISWRNTIGGDGIHNYYDTGIPVVTQHIS